MRSSGVGSPSTLLRVDLDSTSPQGLNLQTGLCRLLGHLPKLLASLSFVQAAPQNPTCARAGFLAEYRLALFFLSRQE